MNCRYRNVHYTLKDNFLRFWFRFVWKYQSLIELRAYGRLQDVILRDYRTFSGKALEDYYQHKFAESGKFAKRCAMEWLKNLKKVRVGRC